MSNSFNLRETISTKPLAQGAALLLMSLVAFAISSANTKPNDASWIIMNCAVLMFAVGNPLIGIFTKKWVRYTGVSLIAFATLTFSLYFLTHKFCNKPSAEVAQYKFVLITLIVFYVMLVGISALFRTIIHTLEGRNI